MEAQLHKGTTTVGIVCKEGVILAADKRTSAGYMIADKKTEKVKKISDHMAITTAGLVSDAQLFTKVIRAQLRLISIRKGKEPSVKEAANLLGNMSYQNIRQPSMIQGIVGFLLGGVDKYGNHLYEIGCDGSLSYADDYRADGSGCTVALGVLETLYKKDMGMEEGVKVAAKAINAAVHRDMASGDGIDVFAITKEGVKKVMQKQVSVDLL